MALSTVKYEKFYETSGGGADEVSTKDLANITANWALDKAEGCKTLLSHPFLGPLVYQLQQMQDEIDYLRTEISSNKDKTDTTTISTAQANEITASTTLGTKLNVTTRPASLTKSTAITFGEFTTTVVGKTTTYSIPITVVETDTSGKSTVTTTKTGSITLT